MAQSSNVGTIHIGKTVGREGLHQALVDFGFGKRTGISPAESAGLLPALEDWQGPDLAASSIGTFQTTTAVQLWAAYNVIANDGMYVAPRLIDQVEAPNGDVKIPEIPERRRVVSEEAAEQVRIALRTVVTEGTGKLWDLQGFEIGAKTGTGRMVSPDPADREDGYIWSDGRYHHVASFTGFFPVSDPKVSITVILEDVEYGLSGSTAAGPVFSELSKIAIRELGIVPVGDSNSELSGPQRAEPAGAIQEDAGQASQSDDDEQ